MLVNKERRFTGLLQSQRGFVHHVLASIVVIAGILILISSVIKQKMPDMPQQLSAAQDGISADGVRKRAYDLIDRQAQLEKAAVDEALKAWDKMDQETKRKFAEGIMSHIKADRVMSERIGNRENKNNN